MCGGEGARVVGGMHGRGHAWQGGHAWHRVVCMAGGHAWQGACVVGKTAIAVGGTHPTGMHSCYGDVM